MELKTLKDFNITGYNKKGETLYRGLDPSQMDALKQEGIKWIKELENKKHPKYLIKKDKEAQAFSEGVQLGIINWIKNFFNINEEDLNNGKRKS